MSSLKPKFNPEINFGHIVQIIVGVSMLVGLYVKFDSRLARVEDRTVRNEERAVETRARVVEHDRTIEVLERAVVKLTTIQEERNRPRL